MHPAPYESGSRLELGLASERAVRGRRQRACSAERRSLQRLARCSPSERAWRGYSLHQCQSLGFQQHLQYGDHEQAADGQQCDAGQLRRAATRDPPQSQQGQPVEAHELDDEAANWSQIPA